MPRLPVGSMVDRIRKAANINEQKYDTSDKERMNNNLVDYSFFAKKVLPQLKALKKAIEQSKSVKTQAIASHKVFLHLTDKYEELNLTAHVEGDTEKMVFGNTKNKDLKMQMDHMVENLKNPFDEMYHWCKGEIYDIQALQTAIAQRDAIEKDIKKVESKKKNAQADLDNV